MNIIKKLTDVHNSGNSYIIYKSEKGFDLYTNFSKKIILNKKNIYNFLDKKNINSKSNGTDLFIGFFGYELLNNLKCNLFSKRYFYYSIYIHTSK